jgi:hypothetical protein
MFVFGSRVSTRTRTVTGDLCGCARPAMSLGPRFEVRELGEIDMVPTALATLDLVAHDDARLAFPAAYLEGHAVPSYGELAAVSGIQAGGLYSGAEPRSTVQTTADAYVDAVRAVRSPGPCLLGGCASGAAIACEITARFWWADQR